MPDQKISDLPDGGDPQNTDDFVVARGATNNKIAWSSMSNAVATAVTASQIAVTADGNTAGALALVNTGTMTLAGGNNITLSQAGNAITISGANAGGAQTGISAIGNSETTYTSGTVSLLESGAITILSSAGQKFLFSVDPQSVQPETQTFLGGVQASDATYTSGTVVLTGSGAATVKSGAGQQVIIDVPSQSVQPETQTFIGGISASDTVYTSGTVRITGVGGGVTVSSNTGQRIDISVAAPIAQTAQTGISGIANSQTTYTSGTVSLSELGAITIRSTTGNQYQFSVNAQSVQPETQTFIGGVGNSQTTYTSGTVNLSVVGGNLTIRSTTGNAFQFSASQSVQAETQTFLGGVAGSNTTYTSGTVVFTGSNMITVKSSAANQTIIIDATQTNQSAIKALGVSNTGNTAGNTGVSTGIDWVIAGSGGITASESTAGGGPNTIWMSVANPVAQTNQSAIKAMGVSNTGNTAGNTGVSTGIDWVMAASGAITASESTAVGGPNTVWMSVAAQSVQTQDVLSVGVSSGGNTAGNTTVNTGSRLVFVGSNMVTLSEGTAAGATTLTIQATQTNQSAIKAFGASNTGNTAGNTGVSTGVDWVLAASTNITVSQSTAVGGPNTLWLSGVNAAGGNFSAGVSTAGNTAGSTGVTGTRLVLVGSNMVSLSQATDANGGTVTFNATQTNQSAIKGIGVSNTGNTAGNTGLSTGQDFIFAASGGVTASESTGAATNTIWISAPATSSLVGSSGISISTNGSTITVYQPAISNFEVNNEVLYSSSSSAISQNTNVSIIRFIVPDVVSFSRVEIPMIVSLGTAGNTNAAAHSISKVMNLYTRNASTLNAITGTSQTEIFSWASSTGNYLSFTGPRLMSFPLATYMTPGEYYIAYYLSTVTFSSVGGANSTNLGGTYGPLFLTGPQTATMWQSFNAATAQTLSPVSFMEGVQSVSLSATNQTIQASNVTQSGTAAARAHQMLIFRN